MRSAILSSRVGLLGVAVVGVVPAHLLTYAAAIRGADVRGTVLSHTGHTYWDAALPVALLAGGWSILAVAWRCFRWAARGRPVAAERLLPLGMRLVPLQLGLFVAVEVVERLIAGAPLATLFDHGLVFLGAAVQLLVTLAITLLLLILGRVAEVIGLALRNLLLARSSDVAFPIRRPALVRSVLLGGAGSVRGPPSRA